MIETIEGWSRRLITAPIRTATGINLAAYRKRSLCRGWIWEGRIEIRPRRKSRRKSVKIACTLGSSGKSRAANDPFSALFVFQGGKRSGRNLGKLSYAHWLIINRLSFRLIPIVDPSSNDSISFLLAYWSSRSSCKEKRDRFSDSARKEKKKLKVNTLHENFACYRALGLSRVRAYCSDRKKCFNVTYRILFYTDARVTVS